MWIDDGARQAYFGANNFRADSNQLAQVKDAIRSNGVWEERFEWRIFTVRVTRIEPAEINGFKAFKLTVESDYKMECYCPTVERAVEYQQIFSQLICDLFLHFGWGSWAAKGRMNPINGEMIP